LFGVDEVFMTLALHARTFSCDEGKPVVVVLHGLFASSDNLLTLCKHLATTHEVHALDLRNHGQSPQHASMRYSDMADDVLGYMDANKLACVSLVGHSMGGKTCMKVALQSPKRVSQMIVADIAPVKYAPGHSDIIAGLEVLDNEVLTSRKQADKKLADYIDTPSVRQFLLKSLRRDAAGIYRFRFNLKGIVANYNNVIDALDSAGAYPGPVLFISGQFSNYILPKYRPQTLALFPAAQIKVINGTTHWLHAEKPETFNAICTRFLLKGG
jgi:esterase